MIEMARKWSSGRTSNLRVASSKYESALANLLSFSDLPEGWHYGTGRAPTTAVIRRSVLVMKEMHTSGATTIEVFPHASDGVLVVGYNGDDSMEVFCGLDEKHDFVLEVNDRECFSVEGVSFYEALAQIRRHRWPENSCTLCIPSTTAEQKGGTLALPSACHRTGASRSSIGPASELHGVPSANISHSFTRPQSLVILPSSGNLTGTPYLEKAA